jgi:hypothetical protein
VSLNLSFGLFSLVLLLHTLKLGNTGNRHHGVALHIRIGMQEFRFNSMSTPDRLEVSLAMTHGVRLHRFNGTMREYISLLLLVWETATPQGSSGCFIALLNSITIAKP